MWGKIHGKRTGGKKRGIERKEERTTCLPQATEKERERKTIER